MTPLARIDYGAPTVTVAIASDDNYVPLAAAMLASLADNANPRTVYEIVILDCGITDYRRRVLDWFLRRLTPLTVRYVQVGHALDGLYASRHATVATYARLLIPETLPNHDVVIYLDVDTIVLTDIARLCTWDLGRSYLAATTNCVVLSGMRCTVAEFGLSHRDYLTSHLHLTSSEADSYFNAGVLLLNNQRIKHDRIFESILRSHASIRCAFWDQDLLNLALRSGRSLLDIRWNVANAHEQTFVRVHPDFDDLMAARESPFIVHFTIKPWDQRPHRYAEYFWYYLRRTPFYEQCPPTQRAAL